MKLENQVCNIEQSKKLKEFGITAEPLFWHTVSIDPITPKDIIQKWQHSHFDVCEKYPAYTVAELALLLPNNQGYNSRLSVPSFEWVCEDGFENFQTEGETEAECRANMLIYLLENGLSIEYCNSRLAD